MNYNKPPPYKRENWDSLNEGQKRYAMEQYNLALVRRGHVFTPPVLGNNPSTSDQSMPPPIFHTNPVQMEVGSTVQSPQKRPAETPVSTGGKKKKGVGIGTGRNTDGTVDGGTGGANAMSIPRGITVLENLFIFNKTWKFLSYGIANQILLDSVGKADRYALTTSLANIPWEYAFFYISPAEWNNIKSYKNVYAISCHIEITQHNPRVAFETNATSTNLATLNQNKFINIAKGIRQQSAIVSSDRDYVFDAKQPMKPTGFDTKTAWDSRKELMKHFYGLSPDDTTTIQNFVPAYATGHELALQRYLTVYTGKKFTGGFPVLNNFVEEHNAVDSTGSIVLSEDYEFQNAPLTLSHDVMHDVKLYEKEIQFHTLAAGSSTNLPQAFVVGPDFLKANPTVKLADYRFMCQTEDANTTTDILNTDNMYYKYPVEQSGIYSKLPGRLTYPAQQPSIHVGIRAVPALTTTANLIAAQEWSDTQVYWTVKASMILRHEAPFNYIHNKPYNSPNETLIGMTHPTTDSAGKTTYSQALQTYDFPYVSGKPTIHTLSAQPLTRNSFFDGRQVNAIQTVSHAAKSVQIENSNLSKEIVQLKDDLSKVNSTLKSLSSSPRSSHTGYHSQIPH